MQFPGKGDSGKQADVKGKSKGNKGGKQQSVFRFGRKGKGKGEDTGSKGKGKGKQKGKPQAFN